MEKTYRSDAPDYYNEIFAVRENSHDLTVMTNKDNEKESRMAFYHIMPGIDVVYNKFDTSHCVEADYQPDALNVIEINHCRQGRYGCQINDKMFYLGVDEIEANILGIDRINPEFPLGYYEGIEILIDVAKASQYLEHMFPDIAEQIRNLHRILQDHSHVVRIKNEPELKHIFEELYNVNSAGLISYIKIKVLEIILTLETVPLEEKVEDVKYYRKNEYQKVKNIHHELITNLDKRITLGEMAEKYGISLTSLKNCFKQVYGCPYYTYIKRYKMHKAVHYLDETDDSISEIAGKLGYDNPSKFISAFRSILKCTPRQYKNKNVRLEHLELFGVEIE